MSRCASRTLSRKNSTRDESKGKDNFTRLKSVFEIRRPNKPPRSNLRKTKSTSHLSVTHNSDDDEPKYTNDMPIERNCSTRSSIRSIKVKSTSDQLNEHDMTNNDLNDSDKTIMSTEELSTQAKRQKDTKDNSCDISSISLNRDHLENFREIQKKLNKIYANQNKYSLKDGDSKSFEEDIAERKFIKNDNRPNNTKTHYHAQGGLVPNSSTSSNKTLKELISQKQAKDRRKTIKSFAEAECEGETETYRKSLVLEMDLEVAKMKLDGFIDEDEHVFDSTTPLEYVEVEKMHYNKVSRYKQLFEGMFHELDNMEIFQTECDTKTTEELGTKHDNRQHDYERQKSDLFEQEEHSDCEECLEGLVDDSKVCSSEHHAETMLLDNKKVDNASFEDYGAKDDASLQKRQKNEENEFCESLGDDLENGSFFVEAYNDDGRELVIVEISIERRSVNFATPFPMESIQNSFKNSDMVFQQKNDKSLNLINDPKEFVNEYTELVSYGPHSNRSTLYSTTSRDSDIFDTDDEGIDMGKIEQRNLEVNAYNNARRETFCDDKGIVRIERIGYPETVHGTTFEEGAEFQTPVSRNNSFTQKGTLSYIIDEIKSTEIKYVQDLQKVVHKYVPYIEKHTPPNLMGKSCYIFGNIHNLLHYQKQFLDALEKCDEEVEDIIKTFIDFEHLFELYPNYFKNKPRADVVLREFSPIVKRAQNKFKERLDLSAYLLTPLQRLGKYKLFLENIEKQLEKLKLSTGSATMALDIIKRNMSKGNDFVAIESIENSPINKADYGSFKMREKFNIIKPRRFDAMVFLFENIIVFTFNNQGNVESYLYYDSIKMNDLRIATFEDLTIHLTDFTKCKKVSKTDKYTYVLEAKTEKIKDTWRKTIEDMLWQQLLKVKENTLKMYQSKAAKKGRVSRNRTKSTGASTFYVTI